jgi:hypothetical protein
LDRNGGDAVQAEVMLRSVSMVKVRRVLLLGAMAAAVSCVPRREPPPPPPQPQALPPAPVRPVPVPPPPQADWRDIPLTPGRWSYRSEAQGSQAFYGPANSEASFVIRCDRSTRQIRLAREGRAAGNVMTLRTSYGARNLPASAQAEPLPSVSAMLPASDRTLDQIAFSRGRFTIEVPGLPMLVIPSWAEPARVIEDCRG